MFPDQLVNSRVGGDFAVKVDIVTFFDFILCKVLAQPQPKLGEIWSKTEYRLSRVKQCDLHDTSKVIIFSIREPANTGFSALHLRDFSFSRTDGVYFRVLTVEFPSSDTFK